MPSADVLAQIAAIIAGITGLITAIGGYFQHRKIDTVSAVAADTNAKIQTTNGSTLGEIASKADDVANALTKTVEPKPGA